MTLNPLFVVLLFVLVRAWDIAISSNLARDYVRGIAYGIVAILALIIVVLTVVK